MDGWTGAWVDKCMDNEWIDGWMKKWTKGPMLDRVLVFRQRMP